MPIYEYRCAGCDHRFEALVRGTAAPACPQCASEDLIRELSVFAVGAPAASPRASAPAPCGTCGDPRGPGSCSIN